MLDLMDALHGCPTVKIDASSNLGSSVHTILVVLLAVLILNESNDTYRNLMSNLTIMHSFYCFSRYRH